MPRIGSQPTPQLDLSSLQPTAIATKSSGGKLAHAAVEFESVLLGQWLGNAEKSFATVPGSEDAEDPQGEQMLNFAMGQLAHSIAGKGGFGIAKIVQEGLEHAAAADHHPQPSGIPVTR